MGATAATNSWTRLLARAARDGRTALVFGWGLGVVAALGSPDQTLALYGTLTAGTEVDAEAGRLLFMGMGCVQATLLALAVGLGSLVIRCGLRLCRTAAVVLRARRAEVARG